MILSGKTVLVTGVGTTGMGEAIAKETIHQGGQVVLSCHPSILDRAQRQAEELGGALVLPCDLADDESVAQLATRLRAAGTELGGFVHSVAFAPSSALEKPTINNLTTEEMLETINVSALSLQRLIRHLLGNNGPERVLTNPASGVTLTFGLAVKRVVPPYHVMAIAKAALECIALYEAYTLGPLGIRLNIIDAGLVKTTAARGIRDFMDMLRAAAKVAPLRRNTTREDVAQAACFLLSQESDGITGHTLTVDGGLKLPADTTPPIG